MRYFIIILLATLSFVSKAQSVKITQSTKGEYISVEPIENKSISKQFKIFNYKQFEDYLKTKDKSKTYVINFWATWCAPCVKELPYFEKINTDYASENVEVILVSLDFPKQIDTRLKPFLKDNKLQSEVVLLNDVDANTWIPKVNKDWSGAIPATLIYNSEKSEFYEQSFDYNDLENTLKTFLK
ncbi:TlpA family protein disulfide reductase [Olleya aquimaris]|uniref:TlpA family protein disulfide reductase n=1 Tax=Olleya sediminilitoris TaxID=2795739 RepID=A0ABS1WMT1_9FLAO|nr:TlpA disulfide reductase family protein [Olleya sediminilitoris]AXO81418.1 TlpA family protein disulfide reductase [Olleya aquimaris]MBL7560425.1 TlpA family protein disulfide reductase [Olleya sediminilitoris]